MFQVPDPTIQWPTGGNSNDSSTTSRGWDNDLAETATTDCPEQTVAWAMSVLRQWATDSNIAVSVDELPQLTKEQITSLLSRFVIEVRQPDGGTYEPSRLRLLLGGVQAYMAVREVDELSAEPFAAVRRLVESQLHSALGVTRTRRPSPAALTREQEELLWQCGSLGDYNGTVLLHTLVYLNSRNFLIGCGHHHRRLRYVRPTDHPARAGRRPGLPAVRRRWTRRRTREGRPRRPRQSRPVSREHLPEVRREVSARGPRPVRLLRRAEARTRQRHVVQSRTGRPQRTAGDCAGATEASPERAGGHGSGREVEHTVACHEHVASVGHS